ncbi:toxin-activating lysine-acyltransferase [Yoonia sp. 208BN28-4]|uniref:toxin-activating lysine-acyltransferase n=1 Tax=Yoonia sp. 208BN28-4 TaxID=3126505 RepID=UPI0030B2D166
MTNQIPGLQTLVALYEEALGTSADPDFDTASYLSPFVEAGQIVMGTKRQGGEESHFGFAIWAKVARETHDALADGTLDPRKGGKDALEDGPMAWIVDLVCPPALADTFLKSTTAALFPEQPVMARLLDQNGAARCIVAQQPTPYV